MLNSNVGYVEDNDAISIYDSRMTITKKVYRKYTNGKREVYIAGTTAKSLASSAATVAQITETNRGESAFIAKCGGITYSGFALKSGTDNIININIEHSATISSGVEIAIYFVFFV